MSDNKINTVFTAQDKASPTIAKLKGNMATLGSSTKGPLGGAASGFAALSLGAVGAGVAISTLTDLGGKVSQFLGDSISKASDLNETISKTQSVFGDSADEMLEWGDDAAHAFGLSKSAALDAATQFGGLFKTVGQSADEAGEHAREMTELGADLASFFNTDMQTALESLRSGLSGEAEPMRKFNVFLSEAAVNTKLLALGEKKVGGAWTESQKIMGRYQIILDRTVDAQGDFAKTQDGLANATREFDAALSDLQADIGEDFLGFMKEGAGASNDFLKGLQEIVDLIESGMGIEELSADNSIFAGIVEALAGQLPPELADKMLAGLREARAEAMRELIRDKITGQTGAISDMWAKALGLSGEGGGGGIGSFQKLAEPMAGGIGAAIEKATGKVEPQAKHLGEEVGEALGVGVRDGLDDSKSTVRDAWDDYIFMLKHPMAKAKEIAFIEGKLTGKQLARGLNSSNPDVRAQAEQTRDILEAELAELRGDAAQAGSQAATAYARAFLRNFHLKIPNNVFRPGGKVLDGGRADGGPVSAGGTYLVGERGPELLHMGRNSGSVTPNHAMGSQPIRVISYRELRRLLDEDNGRALALAPG